MLTLLLLRSILLPTLLISIGMVYPCRAFAGTAEPPPAAAEPVVTLTIEQSSRTSSTATAAFRQSAALLPWLKWIGQSGSGGGSGITPDGVEDTLTATASCTPQRIGLLLHNSGSVPRTVCMNFALPQGLWRADAALIPAVPSAEGTASAKLWRMESVLRAVPGKSAKTLTVPAGHYLALRWAETGSEADDALQAARAAATESSNEVMKKRVLAALSPAEDALNLLPALVGRGDREKIGRKVHAALLATGKAQALYQNWREVGNDEGDMAFDNLTLALSEISCAAFNLVPRQSVMVEENGTTTVRVTLTNAGKKTVPLVALGVSKARNDGNTAPSSTSELSVFKALKPGASVSAKFSVSNTTLAKGIVQFISRMGAAVIAACPPSPP